MNAPYKAHTLAFGALLALFSTSTLAATPQADTCDQVRTQIAAQTDVPPSPNIELLGKVGANEHCKFTAAETWRAAWGAKPLNAPAPAQRHSGEDDDD